MDRLDAMRAFVRLVELGSFTRVAAEMRVKQSTVSKWIGRLEDRLGARLVERTSRTRRITESGRLFYARARSILAAYDATEAELLARAPTLTGRLRVSAPVVFGQRHIVPLVPGFLEAHPGVELDLALDDRYVRLLEDGFDVAIRVGTPVDSSLRCRTLGRTARHVVAAPAYLARRSTPAAPGDLAAHDALLHSGVAEWRFERGGRRHPAAVRARFTANSSEALRALAVAGHGLAMLATWLVADDLAAGRLVEVLAGFALPEAPIQALTPPGGPPHPRTVAFVAHVAEGLTLPTLSG